MMYESMMYKSILQKEHNSQILQVKNCLHKQ